VPYAAALVCAGLSALPEFRARSRPRHALQAATAAAAATAAPPLLATARAMSVVSEGNGTRTPSGA